MTNENSTYSQAGVNIDAGVRAVERMSAAVKSTYTAQVLAGIGAFGGLFDAAAFKSMTAPVLAASTDGVGTKSKVAARLNRWDTIGSDLVNHCINDILVQGARPLFFLDYVASSQLDPDQIATIVGSVAAACREAGCALLGGETAEMPGIYQSGEIDLVGTVIGVVEREQIIDGLRIRAGDVLLGLPSTGLHTNGYSLARRVLDELDWNEPKAELGGVTIGDTLLAVHRSYRDPVEKLMDADIDIKGLAHITGGGMIDNLPRILPQGTAAIVQRGTWFEPPIFGLIQKRGSIDANEMFRVFNMGIGMLAVIPADQVREALAALPGDCSVVGRIVDGDGSVTIVQS